MRWPWALAFDRAGKRSAAKIAMTAITTSNSTKVKARRLASRGATRLMPRWAKGFIAFVRPNIIRECFLMKGVFEFQRPLGAFGAHLLDTTTTRPEDVFSLSSLKGGGP